ncbi:glycosyltransferase [Aestuariicella sp. G3-2]|uniref:glycosyltransferase n=1 Tax=Pseudomaricurvus albidus TaxID=2842452 RepID=UPI001C0D3939|nr:glycosyltransferase [Aestuariicella albida]MBU3071678.1 glycosyltransferase [Aestuariicella albida]
MRKVAFFTSIPKDRITGPSYSVTLLANKGLELQLAERAVVFSTKIKSPVNINSHSVRPISSFSLSDFDAFVFSGSFDIKLWWLALKLKLHGKKYVVSARGGLMRELFKKTPLKKGIAYLFFVKPYLRGASAIHFLMDDERLNSIDIGKTSSFVASNSISVPGVAGAGDKENSVTFIGRLDLYHKGLDVLSDGILLLYEKGWPKGFSVNIFGPDFNGGRQYLEKKLTSLISEGHVKLGGAVTGPEKWRLLGQSKFFIHTSRYEGQPQSVMEALIAGCIPILSGGTNMSSIIEDLGIGYRMGSLDSSEVVRVLDEASELNCKDEDLERIRDYGKQLADADRNVTTFYSEALKI